MFNTFTQDLERLRDWLKEHKVKQVALESTGVYWIPVWNVLESARWALYADFNTRVKKGQLIARIDPAPFQAKVDQGQANLDASKAGVANAEAGVRRRPGRESKPQTPLSQSRWRTCRPRNAKVKADRRVQLAKEGVLSKEDVDTAQVTYNTAAADQDAIVAQQRAAEDNVKVAQAELQVAKTQLAANEAQVKQFEAALRSTQIDLDHTYIKAPVDGVVVARHVDVGQTVAASLATPTLVRRQLDLRAVLPQLEMLPNW